MINSYIMTQNMSFTNFSNYYLGIILFILKPQQNFGNTRQTISNIYMQGG